MSRQENDAIKQGNLLRDKGDLDGAIAAYTESISLDSQNAEAYYERAYSYGKKGELDRALIPNKVPQTGRVTLRATSWVTGQNPV